jgi:hypothetical protein
LDTGGLPPNLLDSIAKAKQYADDLWAVAVCYDEDPALSEKNSCEDLAAGKFEADITFPTGRDATCSWNLEDDALQVGADDRYMGITTCVCNGHSVVISQLAPEAALSTPNSTS